MKRIPQYAPGQFKSPLNSVTNTSSLKGINHFFIESLSTQKKQIEVPSSPHRKTVNDLLFVSKGGIKKIVCSDPIGVQDGALIVLPPYKIRTFVSFSENADGFYCHFSDDFIADGIGFKYFQDILHYTDLVNNPVLVLDSKHQSRVFLLLQQMSTVYSDNGDLDLIRLYLFAILGEIRHFVDGLPKRKLNVNETLTLRFRRLITDHIQNIHSIQEYASLLNVSPNHLNKSVKVAIGKTASELINEALLMEAKALLSFPEATVANVAYSLGMEDPSYFSRFFKKHAGVSPSDYRNGLICPNN